MQHEGQGCEELMRLSLAGDKAAYAALLRETTAIIRPYVAKCLGGNTEADDVVQEILISVHKARHTYDGARPYKPWLYAIAKFRIQDFLRKHYGNKLREAIDIDEIYETLAAPVTEQAFSHEYMDEAVKLLPPKQAQILRLMHEEGYTAKEAGEKIGMKESAVKVAAHRAYKILRKKFSDDA